MWSAAAVLVCALAGVAVWRVASHAVAPPTAAMRAAVKRIMAGPIRQKPQPAPPASPSTDRERLLAAGFAMRGVPYRFGAKGPHEYDCSGFTKAAYAGVGISLPDGSFNQARGERPLVTPGALATGDLIFYRWSGSDRVNHVTLYAGDGWVVGTGSPGQPREVAVYPLSDDLLNDGRVITFRHLKLKDE